MMWKTKRQTKKHKTKNRPRVLVQSVYYVAGFMAVVFVVFTVLSLTKGQELIIPVILGGDIGKVKSAMVSLGNEEVEKLLREKNITFLFVTSQSGNGFVVTMPGNAEVILKNENLPEQIASLQLITHRLTMEGKRFSRLDLRYDRPVVVLVN